MKDEEVAGRGGLTLSVLNSQTALSNMPGRSSSLAMMAASCSWYCNSSAFNFCYYWIPSLEFQNRIHSVRFRFLEQNHNMIDIVQWVDGIEPITSAAGICVFWLQDMWLDLLFLNHPIYRTGCGNPLLSLKLWLWLGGDDRNCEPWIKFISALWGLDKNMGA